MIKPFFIGNQHEIARRQFSPERGGGAPEA